MQELIFVCPECELPSSSKSWNEETASKYGDDIFPIEDPVMNQAVFICPHCKKESSGEFILEQSVYERLE